ncbi:MAG: glycoside hydrolase family 88 protein [Prevotella sp.]|nr:glycoside hydrolase family 88 protein [Prevotella sp.]
MKKKTICAFLAVTMATTTMAQQNDSNAPLHLMKPAYTHDYGALTVEKVKNDLSRVFNFVEQNTPARMENGKPVSGAFRLTSYEWGVTYSAMLAATQATGDKKYRDYTFDRLRFITEHAKHYRQVSSPAALDDAGAVCAAMIKASLQDKNLKLDERIRHYMDYILHQEYRLRDGTFARTRPQHNTVWLDDMFMGVPPIAWYGLYDKDNAADHFNEAVCQIRGFKDRMWVPEVKLFRHGWVESMSPHPSFHWARANGWAILTMCEVLDALPENHEGRAEIMQLLKLHAEGLAACQGANGFWHQLLNRTDSYEETSATAIYAYCLAHAINKGWLDAKAYGPVAVLAWHAVSSKINEKGQVEDVCVGTGMGFDPAFYYYRPVNVFAAHGYGPVIWAGAEIINLINNQHMQLNDSALQFYDEDPQTNEPIFHVK